MDGASDLVAELEQVSISERDLPSSPQAASPLTSESKVDEIRTIFVLGFPRDMKERELHNLLRWWPGYVACQLTQGSGDQQAMGFALFETAAMAVAAKDALQNLVFDAETNSVLRAEMAKKNLYVRRAQEGGSESYSELRRIRGGGQESRKAGGEPKKASPTGQEQVAGQGGVPPYNWPSGPGGYMPPHSYNAYANYFAAAAAMGPQSGHLPHGAHQGVPMHMPSPPMAPMMLAGYAPVQNTKDNPPCNTLFVGNLSESVLESELRGLFHNQPGFRQMKILRQQNGTTCFVEFLDVPSAMNVHHNLQGAILSSSTDKGGMRIQYSKNPYGRKRDLGTPAHASSDGEMQDGKAVQHNPKSASF